MIIFTDSFNKIFSGYVLRATDVRPETVIKDLNQFSRMLTKLTVETVLNAELTDHLGHEKMLLNQSLTPETVTRQKHCSVMTVRV